MQNYFYRRGAAQYSKQAENNLQSMTDGQAHETSADTHVKLLAIVTLNHSKQCSKEQDEISNKFDANSQPPDCAHHRVVSCLITVDSSLVLHDKALLSMVGANVGGTSDGFSKVGENG